MIKIYFLPRPKKSYPPREFLLLEQGLIENKRVELVEDEASCDFIFAHYSPWLLWTRDHPNMKLDPAKLIFIDYGDPASRMFPVECKAYFKRSWTVRPKPDDFSIRVPLSFPDNYHPINHAIMNEFTIDENIERDIDLLCTLRPTRVGTNRIKVIDFLKGLEIKGTKYIGEVNKTIRRGFSRGYSRFLKRGRLAITCMPYPHEGDFRTWEAFASGALVFVDRPYTPTAHPLVDGEHCIFYIVSKEGLEELGEKIRYFIAHKEQVEKIAKQGYEFTMRYHRATNRIDEILNVILNGVPS